jgi:hypothetical protein
LSAYFPTWLSDRWLGSDLKAKILKRKEKQQNNINLSVAIRYFPLFSSIMVNVLGA